MGPERDVLGLPGVCLRGCLGGCLRGCCGAVWGIIMADDKRGRPSTAPHKSSGRGGLRPPNPDDLYCPNHLPKPSPQTAPQTAWQIAPQTAPQMAPTTAPQTPLQTGAQTAPRQPQDIPLRPHLVNLQYSSYKAGIPSPGESPWGPPGRAPGDLPGDPPGGYAWTTLQGTPPGTIGGRLASHLLRSRTTLLVTVMRA